MKIVNIVITVKLPSELDLDFLNSQLKNSSRHSKHHWLKFRIPTDNSYIAFYKSGKFLMTVKSFEQADRNMKYVLSLLKKVNIPTKGSQSTIHNIVLSDNFESHISLEKLVAFLDRDKASYEPEQFPALIFKDNGVCFLIFSTGKMIITGSKTIQQGEERIKEFKDLIKKMK